MVIISCCWCHRRPVPFCRTPLSGRDKALQQLQLQLNELSDLLALEKRSSAELRSGNSEPDCSAAAAIAERDAQTTRVAELAQGGAGGRARRSRRRKIA